MGRSANAPGLQAADLLAYHTYNHAKSRAFRSVAPRVSELPWVLRGAMKNLRTEKNHQFFNERGLEQALWNLPEYVRRSEDDFPVLIPRSS